MKPHQPKLFLKKFDQKEIFDRDLRLYNIIAYNIGKNNDLIPCLVKNDKKAIDFIIHEVMKANGLRMTPYIAKKKIIAQTMIYEVNRLNELTNRGL